MKTFRSTGHWRRCSSRRRAALVVFRGAAAERPGGRADRAGLGVEAEHRGRSTSPPRSPWCRRRTGRPTGCCACRPSAATPRTCTRSSSSTPTARRAKGTCAGATTCTSTCPPRGSSSTEPQGQHRVHRRAHGPLRPAEDPGAVLRHLRGHGHRVEVGVRRGAAGREGARRLLPRAEVVRAEERRAAGEGGELLRLGDAPGHLLLHRVQEPGKGQVALHEAPRGQQPRERASRPSSPTTTSPRPPSPTTPSPRHTSRRSPDDAAAVVLARRRSCCCLAGVLRFRAGVRRAAGGRTSSTPRLRPERPAEHAAGAEGEAGDAVRRKLPVRHLRHDHRGLRRVRGGGQPSRARRSPR